MLEVEGGTQHFRMQNPRVWFNDSCGSCDCGDPNEVGYAPAYSAYRTHNY